MNITQDIRFAFRKLRKTPAHTLITLIVLVLGLSLYIASYSFSRMQTDKPMPFSNGDRYVALKAIDPKIGFDQWEGAFDFQTFFRLKETSDNYSVLAAMQLKPATLSADEGYAKRYGGATLSTEILSATGVNPILGRGFSPDDARASSPNVALISYAVWQDVFNGRNDIVGQIASVNNENHTIIGVMPKGFHFPSYEFLWFPLRPDTVTQAELNEPVTLAGIIKPGLSHEAAKLELDQLLSQLANEFPDDYSDRTGLVVPYAQAEESSTFRFSLSILIIAYVLLALTVVNLSSLLFMRATARQDELAVRASVGGTGIDLAKQVLIESLMICGTGLVLSLLLSIVMLKVLAQVYWDEVFWYTFTIDGRTLWVAVLCTSLIWLVSSLSVAFRAWSTRPGSILNESSPASGSRHGAKVSNTVVAIEVILSCFLLVATGSAVIGFQRTAVTDFGIDSENTAVARFDVSPLANQGTPEILNFVSNLVQEAESLPDVVSAGVASRFPGWNGIGGQYQTAEMVGVVDRDNLPRQSSIWVGNNYFDAIGIDLMEGRGFNAGDTENSRAVTIISQQFANELWPNESAIGKQIISVVDNREKQLMVVGTIEHLVQASNNMSVFLMPTLYRPLAQKPPSTLYLVFNHRPGATLSELERSIGLAAARVDRTIALERFEHLDIAVHQNEGPAMFLIMETFALSTLVLAAIGVFAVMSRSILQRTRDIGICRALGANRTRVFFRYGKHGVLFLAAGIVFGSLPAVIVLTYFLGDGMGSSNIALIPVIGLGITGAMALIIAVACVIPTRMALRLQPGDALRYE